MRAFTRIALAISAAGTALAVGGTAAVAAASNSASGTASGTPHPTTRVARPAVAGLSCAGLDQTFQNPQTNGSYPVTIVSNQPDGITGFAGAETIYGATSSGIPGRFTGTQLTGSTGNYLFSDRSTYIPSPGGGFGTYQPFSINGPATLTYTLTKNSPGHYTIALNFGANIYRQFTFPAQCIGESLVGYTSAIGNNERTDDATYTITVGNFAADPIIH